MLWIAGGAGITPFMSMWDGIVQVAKENPEQISTDIVFLFAGRDDDINVLRHFQAMQSTPLKQVKLRIVALQSVSSSPPVERSAQTGLCELFSANVLKLEERRIQIDDIKSVTNLSDRDVFMCGPDALMEWCERSLTELNVEDAHRHRESFTF